MNMFSKLMANPEGGIPGTGEGGEGLDKMMEQFTHFLKASEGDGDMNGALDQIVSEMLTKDTLYEPMKTMREEYPLWLEENW